MWVGRQKAWYVFAGWVLLSVGTRCGGKSTSLRSQCGADCNDAGGYTDTSAGESSVTDASAVDVAEQDIDVPTSCGDAVVDPSEDCDLGAGNNDTLPCECRTDCTHCWKQIAYPKGGNLLSVIGLDEKTFAVASCIAKVDDEPPIGGTVQLFDGSGWTVSYDEPADWAFGLWGTSPADLYVVTRTPPALSTKLRHFNGTTWVTIRDGAPDEQYANVIGFPNGDLVLVGRDTNLEQGLVVERKAGSWKKYWILEAEDFAGVWGPSADDYFLSGWPSIVVRGATGSYAVSMKQPEPGRLFGAWGTTSSDVYVAGSSEGAPRASPGLQGANAPWPSEHPDEKVQPRVNINAALNLHDDVIERGRNVCVAATLEACGA